MQDSQSNRGGEGGIWIGILAILILFTGVIFFAMHVNTKRQTQSAVPVVAHYNNYAYGVSLRYPPAWQPVGGQQYDRYEGSDGFFSISAGGSAKQKIEELVQNEITHPLHPYGHTPTVLNLNIDGQDARLIMPSFDQDTGMHGQAVLIAKYPKPVTVGSDTYSYLVFWADRAHIQDMASSIVFLNK